VLCAVWLAACSGDDTPGTPVAQAKTPTPAVRAGTSGGPGGGMADGPGGRSAPAITLAAGDVGRVTRGAIEDAIAITGDLRPIETVEVKARIEGDLVGVLVREGQRVTEGQLLARFESSEQESAQASAEADRVAAQSELATAKWNLDQTGELFRAGAVAERDFKAAQQSVASANARLAAAQAALAERGTMDRTRSTV